MIGDPQPTKHNVQKSPRVSRNKKNLIFVQILIVGLLVALIYFLYQNNIKRIYTGGTEEIIVQDDTISKEAAEFKTIDTNVEPSPVSEDKILEGSTTIDIDSDFALLSVFKLNSNGELTISPAISAQSQEVYPLISADRDILQYAILDVDALSTKIFNELKIRNYNNIVVDHTVFRASNYLEFLQKIKLTASTSGVNFSIKIFPVWGKDLDYRFHGNISAVVGYDKNLFDIVKSSDKVFVEAYGYTNEYSMLAGPIAPINWVRTVLKFFIFEGIQRDRIFLIANTKKYLWENREFEENPKKNFSVGALEGQVVETIPLTEISRNEISISLEQKVIYKDTNGKEYIAVESTESSVRKVRELVLEFGGGGVVGLQ